MYRFSFPLFNACCSRTVVLCGALLALCGSLGQLAHADDDHERARRALEHGKVLPLRSLLTQLERQYGGEVVKVDFEDDDGGYVYEIRLVRPQGQVLELEVDAVTGRVLDVEEDD
ncbi:MAG: PepSY domain-containing protein [Comamonas sp.]|nr:PepSY domain-containing protein [Comamonas sp.]